MYLLPVVTHIELPKKKQINGITFCELYKIISLSAFFYEGALQRFYNKDQFTCHEDAWCLWWLQVGESGKALTVIRNIFMPLLESHCVEFNFQKPLLIPGGNCFTLLSVCSLFREKIGASTQT